MTWISPRTQLPRCPATWRGPKPREQSPEIRCQRESGHRGRHCGRLVSYFVQPRWSFLFWTDHDLEDLETVGAVVGG